MKASGNGRIHQSDQESKLMRAEVTLSCLDGLVSLTSWIKSMNQMDFHIQRSRSAMRIMELLTEAVPVFVCVSTHTHTCACSISKLCLILRDPMDLPVSSVHVILQNTGVGSHFLLQWNLFDPGIEPTSQAWQTDSLPLRHQGSIHTHTHTRLGLESPQWSSRQKGKVSASLVLELKALGQRTQPYKYPTMSDI